MKYVKLSKDEVISKIAKPERDLINSTSINKSLIKSEVQDRFQSSLLNSSKQVSIAPNLDGEINLSNSFAKQGYDFFSEEVLGRNLKH